MEFSNIFNDLIEKSTFSAYKISQDTGVPQSSISDYRNGKKKPTIENILTFAKYFEISIDYLLTGEEAIQPRAAQMLELDDTQKDLLEILENFEGRDRERFVGRCEDLAERMIAKQKLVGDTTGDQRPAQARDA